MKPPFNRGPLSPGEHPIAYLLILCDELQEWNRFAYGIMDKKRDLADEASLLINDNRLEMNYIDRDGVLPDEFAPDKEALLSKLLDMGALFAEGFSIKCETMRTLPATYSLIDQEADITPRQLLSNHEKLAAAIHDLYNQKQLERHPEKPLSYPQFSDLPDALKYSNLRQARGLSKKLDLMGWEMRPEGSDGEVITEIPDDIVEILSVFEHDEWVRERLGRGWIFGEVKDDEKKISPYLMPYDELSEEVKTLDRDTVRNIPTLLSMIGMAAYVKKKADSFPESKPILARRLPESYKD